jgi:NAD(P)-dependent dehydrogenase (short-subunit alcohol dehydrogenase family)
MAELTPEPDYGEATYRGHGRLAGRVALITEADSGIGRAVAIGFAREGADLVLSCIEDRAEIDITAAWAIKAGRRALVSLGDVRNERYRHSLVHAAVESLGRLDILVSNNAFQWAHRTLGGADATQMEEEIRTHNESIFFLSQAAAAAMRPGGSIIHTTPVQSEHPDAQIRAYATTQMAVINFTASFAQQLAAERIRVNAVAPGPVWTQRIVTMLPPESIERFGRETLRGRPAQPAELAPVYVFLASEESQLITGAVLPVGQ